MARIVLISRGNRVLATALLRALGQLSCHECSLSDGLAVTDEHTPGKEVTYVYLTSDADPSGMLPDLAEAEKVFAQSVMFRPRRLILLSSAMVYGAGPGRQSLVTEEYGTGSTRGDRISRTWRVLEDSARRHLRDKVRLTILRPVTVMPSNTLLSRRLMSGITLTLAGHDPIVQLLSASDLAR